MKKITIALFFLALLQGCAVALFGGFGAGATSLNDPRPFDVQVDDQTIEIQGLRDIVENEALSKATNVQVISLNHTVLLVGQAETAADKDKVHKIISAIPKVKKIHNQIRIAKLSTVGTKATDSWLTTKVKSSLLTDDRLDGSIIKVISEDSEVFLMGLVSSKDANTAVEIARHIDGVSRVYKAFEIKK